jgi:hypothetical protein
VDPCSIGGGTQQRGKISLILYNLKYFDVIGSLNPKQFLDVHVCTLGALGVSSLMCAIKRPLRGALQRVT